MIERTTDLEQLLKGAPFTWGKLVRIHQIGRYAIVEYRPWTRTGFVVNTGKAGKKLGFHPYVDGKDTSRTFDDIESAMAGAIAYAFDGCNSQAGEMFMRMVRGRTNA